MDQTAVGLDEVIAELRDLVKEIRDLLAKQIDESQLRIEMEYGVDTGLMP